MTYSSEQSTVENFAGNEKRSIFVVFAPDIKTGILAYYFVAIRPKMEKSFLDAVKSGPTYLENFGSVIFSGLGEKIPESVKKFMKLKYGIQAKKKA